MKKAHLIFILLLAISIPTFSQKTKKERSEELQFLKEQQVLNLRFDYDGMLIGEMPQDAYIQEKVDNKNAKSPGNGDRWLSEWNQNKSEDFPQRFKVLFDKHLQKEKLKVAFDTTANYTLIVKTIKLEPGFHTGTPVNSPAFADFEFYFVKTDNPQVVLLKMKVKEVQGTAGFASFDSGIRMGECYAKAAKIVAGYIADYAF